MVTEGFIMYGLGLLITGLVWGVRLEGRVNAAEERDKAIKEHLRELLDLKFEPVNVRLERIERSLNGSGKGADYGGRH